MLTESTLNAPEMRAAIRRAYDLGKTRAIADARRRWRRVFLDAAIAAAFMLPGAYLAGRFIG